MDQAGITGKKKLLKSIITLYRKTFWLNQKTFNIYVHDAIHISKGYMIILEYISKDRNTIEVFFAQRAS